MRSLISGLVRINSTAAVMRESILLISWRMRESLRFSSSTCWALKVIGWLAVAIKGRCAEAGDNGKTEGLPQFCVVLPFTSVHGPRELIRGTVFFLTPPERFLFEPIRHSGV